jgi:hypothetical protein
MPTSRGRASAHAHPNRAPALSAQIACGAFWLLPILTQRQRSMPSSQFSRPSLPLSRNRDCIMLSRRCCAIAHAHPEGVPACHALVAATALSVMLTLFQRWRDWLSQVLRAFSYPPRWPNTPIQPTPLRVPRSGRFYAPESATMTSRSTGAARLMGNSLGRDFAKPCFNACYVKCWRSDRGISPP